MWSWYVCHPFNVLNFGKREIESRASINRRFAANLPAVAVDDTLSGGQSYSGAFKLFRQMQALKDAEQLVDVLHVKARAVVLHEHLEFFFIAVDPADLDFGGASHACEFDRIGNKVDNDQPQHGTVSVADRKRADLPDNVPPPG